MTAATDCRYENKTISVSKALSIVARVKSRLPIGTFKCIECGQAVRPHKSGGNQSAHLEHLKRNPACPLSHVKRNRKKEHALTRDGSDWSTAELRAAVKAYFEMFSAKRAGAPLVKKHVYAKLSERHAKRTAKSFEYRMQNISYVLSLLGRDWLEGLPPASNVGVRVAGQIETLIAELENKRREPIAGEEAEVRRLRKRKARSTKTLPVGNRKPKLRSVQTVVYERDREVRAWVLNNSNGRCECCHRKAPFLDSDRLPFLEVHHLRQLADGGTDTLQNAVAICANCHRHLHHGIDKSVVLDKLYSKIDRLIRE